MSEETLDKDFVIEALKESNEILQGEIRQLRNSNRILRRVNSALRGALTSLRNQVAIAQDNDERFKELCNGFDADGTGSVEGGLLESQPMAEPTV